MINVRRFAAVLTLFVVASLASASEDQSSPSSVNYIEGQLLPFAWPFLEPAQMTSQGGITRGAPVVLDKVPDPRWTNLQETSSGDFERDRFAILAMAGDYRTSFQFTETGGFMEDYAPPHPYFSWGTEHVAVIEDRGEFISLQHTLVMYFQDESGETTGPFVMKHWRQDWTYEDPDLHTFRGNGVWARHRVPESEIAGTWSQAVFQVDDSPRYEVTGRWQHGDQFSAWQSDTTQRPLPRREFSIRDDYNILSGEHRITILPTGWMHEQHNRKIRKTDERTEYVAQEIGVNRYERISEPDLGAAQATWAVTGPYWQAVRGAWSEILRDQDQFRLKREYEGRRLFEVHFAHAAAIEGAGAYDPNKWDEEARNTVRQFVEFSDESDQNTDY